MQSAALLWNAKPTACIFTMIRLMCLLISRPSRGIWKTCVTTSAATAAGRAASRGAKKSWRGEALTPFGTGSTMRGIPGDPSSTSRFVKAAFVNNFYPPKESEIDNVMRMFHTLGSVSFSDGMAAMDDGSYELTLYSDCFSAATSTYYYNTYNSPAIQSACLADFANAPTDALISPKTEIFA